MNRETTTVPSAIDLDQFNSWFSILNQLKINGIGNLVQ